MKKALVAVAIATLLPQIGHTADDSFYEDILINPELRAQEQKAQAENAEKAKIRSIGQEAGKLLEAEAPKIDINFHDLEKISSAPQEPKRTAIENLAPAPFGLYWEATVLDIQNTGVSLTRIEDKDYSDSYSALNLPKPISIFDDIKLSFGAENTLWRIIAHSIHQADTPSAQQGLQQYRRFYQMLEKKYGTPQEYFTPRPTNNEQERADTYVDSPDTSIGNPNFLADLQHGGAKLYATFENEEVSASLALNVDDLGQSYLVIEYKNKKVIQAREDKTFDAL